jgi:hypothetical protein
MDTLIGFTAVQNTEETIQQRADAARQRALAHFPHLNQTTLEIGETKISLWGYGTLSDSVHYMPDGSMLVLIGTQGSIQNWETIQTQVWRDALPGSLVPPWEGRFLLIHISADGRQWKMWNDWLGSIPVFHARTDKGWIASTLETAVVSGMEFTSEDIFLPGLIMMLVHGHFLSDWTLYKDMKVIQPDCAAEWDKNGFRYYQRFTVHPSTKHWETSWNDLIDEMHELTCRAIQDVLKTDSTWSLPLSSGLDSRIIAAVGAELGADLRAYTWGTPHSEDAAYAPMIARTLGIPWKWIDTGTDYLEKYVRTWADLFGSGMHFHGMYQMPFLDALRSEGSARIVSGYLGDTLAGYDIHFQTPFHKPDTRTYQTVEDGYLHWKVNEIGKLLKMDTSEALEKIATEIDSARTLMPGPWYQRIRFLTLWGRQRHFTYFQTKLEDYWFGAETPYLNRSYARFCLSLPRAALDHRTLQGEMLKRYYGKIAVIPGSFSPEPLVTSGRYLLTRRIMRALPASLRKGPFRDFSLVPLSRDAVSVRTSGDAAIWPIRETWKQLGDWMDLDLIEQEYQAALAGNIKSVRKLQSIQTLAFRLMDPAQA